jgi:hypothetical protein
MRPEDPKDNGDEPLMTRAQLAERLTDAGFPTTKGSLNTWASLKVGPPVDAWWGKRPMYRWGPSLAWAKGRLKNKPPSKQSKQPNKPEESERDGAHA